MKKIVLILLISIYSLSTYGLSLKEFYCCGKLKSVSFTITKNDKDKCGKDNGKNGCCKIKYQYLKVNDTHLATVQIAAPAKIFTDLRSPIFSLQAVPLIAQEVNVSSGNHAPPILTSVPIYLSNSVFRI